MECFNPEEFVQKLDCGAFDGHVSEEIRKLTHQQLEQVAILMAVRLRRDSEWTGTHVRKDTDWS